MTPEAEETGNQSAADEKDISREDLLEDSERMANPATYVDRFHFTYWKGHLRVAFGETSGKGVDFWRFAVLLEAKDVRRLATRLQNMLPKIEPEEDKKGD